MKNSPNEVDVRQNAGRCDWCGELVEMDDGDRLMMSEQADVNEMEHDLDEQQIANSIARAVERIGGPKDAMLADEIRENGDWRLHGRCYEESALTEIYEQPEVTESV